MSDRIAYARLPQFEHRVTRRLARLFRNSLGGRAQAATLIVVGAFVAVISAPSIAVAATDAPRFHGSGANEDAWLVQFKADVADTAATSAVGAAGATEIGQIDELSEHVVSLPRGRESAVLAKLGRDPRVVSVERDASYQASLLPYNDPDWRQAWGPRLIRAPGAWDMTTGTSSTIIAVVDTGVDARQPDLRGRVLRGWDFQNNDSNAYDDNGHGTAVAGVAAAAANDGVGIAGICWHCLILPVKVLNSSGSGTHSNIAAGIVYATKHGADVINLSLAGPTYSAVVANAVSYARNHGVVVVAAAGNEGTTRKFYPAALPGVLSVGASNGRDVLYNWSNHGSWVKLSAPGCAYAGKPGPSWSWWCGTSFATPAVAGTAALMKSLRPDMTRRQIEHSLLSNTVRVRGIGLGRIDALRGLRTAATYGAPTPTPTP